MSNRVFLTLILILMISALALVNSQFNARRLFVEFEKIQAHKRKLNNEWVELQLEHSKLTRFSRINLIGKKKLKLIMPNQNLTKYIKVK